MHQMEKRTTRIRLNLEPYWAKLLAAAAQSEFLDSADYARRVLLRHLQARDKEAKQVDAAR